MASVPYTPVVMQPVQNIPVRFVMPYPQIISQSAQNYNNFVVPDIYAQPQTNPTPKPVQKAIPPMIQKALELHKVAKAPPLIELAWKNDLKSLFHNNNAVIYALIMRTFNAKDKDGDGLIENGDEPGTFLNAIERLDELKSLGINTLHLLPINPPGKKYAAGTAGSIYAPADYLTIDPKLADPKSSLSLRDQAKEFINECHKRNIRVMIDLPSCASVDMYEKRPELMAKDELGRPKIPQGWTDIRMFEPWKDRDKKILNEDLMKMHEQFIDFALDLGIDGVRADVARAKPLEFWDRLIKYARAKDPDFAFLAETYVHEDASPMANVPADNPEELLKVGFDSMYGQYHMLTYWKTAKEFTDYVTNCLKMSQNVGPNKSLIGSFASHDDKSPMSNGGVLYCDLITGLQATLPMTNPYFVTGFESGDKYIYAYRDKPAHNNTNNDCKTYMAHHEQLDLFNQSRRPGGENPEIGQYMSAIMKIREQYDDIITKGSFIPLKVTGNKEDQIIAYARHYNGRTLVIIANKDVNARQLGTVMIPSLKPNQILADLAPSVSIVSNYGVVSDGIAVNLSPARFHIFEIDTPNIEKESREVYRQNLSL